MRSLSQFKDRAQDPNKQHSDFGKNLIRINGVELDIFLTRLDKTREHVSPNLVATASINLSNPIIVIMRYTLTINMIKL
jgi:hypothetical protein